MKKGITITILTVTVFVMGILASTAVVIGTKSIQTAAYEEFMSKIIRVMNSVNSYVLEKNELPIRNDVVVKSGLNPKLLDEISKKGDSNNELYVIDMTKLNTQSINIGMGSVESLDVFLVTENTHNVYYLKGIKYNGKEYFGLDVTVEQKVPDEWIDTVSTIVNGVPIPKGFVASPINGEREKDKGLVIYELTKDEIAAGRTSISKYESKYTSWTTRNQYVWVPVDDLSISELKRQNWDNDDRTTQISSELGTNYWEVEPISIAGTYANQKTIDEVSSMYQSIVTYGGFYVARYEAGIDKNRSQTDYSQRGVEEDVYFRMNKYPYTWISWSNSSTMNIDVGGAVEAARKIHPEEDEDYGVVSTLTYGVQWDAIVQWLEDSNINIKDSTYYGNYTNHSVESYIELNDNAQYLISGQTKYNKVTANYTKNNGSQVFSTGALKAACVNNIYDMAGNVFEWTMESNGDVNRVLRGGSAYNAGAGVPIGFRYTYVSDYESNGIGFRACLYIKN